MIPEEDLFEGFTIGEWEVIPAKGLLRRGNEEEHLEPKVFAVLIALARRDGNLITTDELIDEVWEGRAFDDRPIQRAITVLRKHLQDTKPFEYIGTLRQRGYRLVKPVQLHKATTPPHTGALSNERGSVGYLWRLIAMAVYVAGAWAAIEVVEYTAQYFGLTQFLVKATVIAAFGGGIVAAVLVWSHGSLGSQKATMSKIGIVGTIVLVTIAGILFLAQNDPTRNFERLDGFRLVFELRDAGEEGVILTAGAGPPEGWHWIGDEAVHFNPEYGHIVGPNLTVKWEEYPVRMQSFEDREYFNVTIVLPFEPKDISNLLSNGLSHTSAQINSENLEISIQKPFEVRNIDSGVYFLIEDF